MSAGAIIPSDIRAGPVGEGSAKPPAGAAPAGVPGPAPASGAAPQNAALFSHNALSAGELFRQAAATLRLPVDALSVTLLAFSRFFSLTPSHALIAALRRDVLASSHSSPQTAAEKAAFEAKVMAAAAAADKGVALSPEALERYARFLDPPAFAEERETGEKSGFPGGGGDGKKNSQNREEAPDKEELRAIAEEEAKEDGLLDFLNAIPGKNGQRWAVYPFCITVKGIELKVFARILHREPFSACQNDQMLVDIVGPKRHYRCSLKSTSGKLKADIQVYPELSPKALKLLSKKAEGFLGKGGALPGNAEFGDIQVRNGEGTPSWAETWLAEYLPYIDKEV